MGLFDGLFGRKSKPAIPVYKAKPSTNGHAKTNMTKQFDKIRADYDMSRESRFVRRRTGLAPQGGSADYHYRVEAAYYRDIEKARDMDRNDCIIGSTVDRAVANIVQDGFSLDVKTGDSKVDADLKAYWSDYASDPQQCDIAGEFSFHDHEHHVMRSMLLDGDIAALALESGHLQLVEAHAIQQHGRMENTFLGVTVDKFRRRKAFHIRTDPMSPYQGTDFQSEPVQVYDSEGNRLVFHVYNPKRVTQTRGVTAFAPIFALSGMFEDIQFAKLVQQQVVSCFAVFRSQAFDPAGDAPPSVAGYGESSAETTAAGTRYIEGISPGMEIVGAPGETLEGFSPNVPNAEFFQHSRLMLQMIGVNLGLPLCLVLMDGSETNFSGWRGAVDEARKGWKCNQINLIQRFHTPVWQWKVRQLLEADPALRAAQASGLNVFGHKWNPPAWRYIEPVNDAQGDALRIQNALTSPRRLHAERGAEWSEIASEMIDDNALAIVNAKRAAITINQQLVDNAPVHWRELISLPMPSGLQMTLQDPELIDTQRGKENGE